MKKIKVLLLLIVVIMTTSSFKAINLFQTQPINPPLIEGGLYKDLATDKIYWLVNGMLRHIEHEPTLHYLFDNPSAWILNVPFFESFSRRPIPGIGNIIGVPISPSTYLLDIEGVVYLRLGVTSSYVHYRIPNPQTFNAYGLNWNNIITVSNYKPMIEGVFPDDM